MGIELVPIKDFTIHLDGLAPVLGAAGQDGNLVALGARERREAVRGVAPTDNSNVQLARLVSRCLLSPRSRETKARGASEAAFSCT